MRWQRTFPGHRMSPAMQLSFCLGEVGFFPLSGPLSSYLLQQPSFESTVLGVRHTRLNPCSFTRYMHCTKLLISESTQQNGDITSLQRAIVRTK